MDDITAWRLGITVLGIIGTLAVTLIGIMVKRLYASIDVLFGRFEPDGQVGLLESRMRRIEQIVLATNADDTIVVRSMLRDPEETQPPRKR